MVRWQSTVPSSQHPCNSANTVMQLTHSWYTSGKRTWATYFIKYDGVLLHLCIFGTVISLYISFFYKEAVVNSKNSRKSNYICYILECTGNHRSFSGFLNQRFSTKNFPSAVRFKVNGIPVIYTFFLLKLIKIKTFEFSDELYMYCIYNLIAMATTTITAHAQ
jgi:hypothetical protein